MTAPPTPFPEPGPDVRLTVALTWDEARQGTVKTVSVDGRPEQINIPAGATDGRELRLPGRGGQSPQGGPAGALLVTLQVAPGPVRGGDIRRTLRLTWEEAQQGGTKPLTVDGRTWDLVYPPGARDGGELRRDSGGSAGRDGGPPGDLIITLQVMPQQSPGLAQPPPRPNAYLETPGQAAQTPAPPITPPVSPPVWPQTPRPGLEAPPQSSAPQRGEDVRLDLPLTAAQARAGGPHGLMVNGQRLDVPVPYGATDGRELRRAGAGMPGRNGGPPGDLVVTVRVPPASVTPPAARPKWLVPVGVVAALIVLGLLLVHFARPKPSPLSPASSSAAVDYSQMQFWKTLPPPGGTADAANPDSANGLAFTSDDTLAVGYWPYRANLVPQLAFWDTQGGTAASPGPLSTLTWLYVHAMAVSPNGADVAVVGFDNRPKGGRYVLAIFDAKTGGIVNSVDAQSKQFTEAVDSVAYSPDGRRIVVGCGDVMDRPGAKTFDPKTIKRVNDNVTVWDASGATADPLASGNGANVWCLRVTPDGTGLSYGQTGHVSQWALRPDGSFNGTAPRTLAQADDTEAFTSLVYAPDGRSLYAVVRTNTGADRIEALDPASGNPTLTFLDQTGAVSYLTAEALAISPDGNVLAVGGRDAHNHGLVTLWNAHSGGLIGQPLPPHDDRVFALAFSPDGRVLACGSNDGAVKLWHVP